MGLNGVHVGELNPDKAERFGQVDGATSARTLIRHHIAMIPAELSRALNSGLNVPRCGDAIDRDEATEAITSSLYEQGMKLPDEDGRVVITGLAVRGEDDAQKYLTYTWALENGDGLMGRTAKGAMRYDAKTFPKSVERGDESVQIAKAQKAGLPYLPQQVLTALMGAAAQGGDDSGAATSEELAEAKRAKEAAESERDEKIAEVDGLRERLEAMERQIASPPAATPPVTELGGQSGNAGAAEAEVTVAGQPPATTTTATEPVDLAETEPFEGYDDLNADVIAARLKDAPEDERGALAAHVSAYERKHDNRATVNKAADAILDRTPTGT